MVKRLEAVISICEGLDIYEQRYIKLGVDYFVQMEEKAKEALRTAGVRSGDGCEAIREYAIAHTRTYLSSIRGGGA